MRTRLVTLFIGASCSVFALDPSIAITQYARKHWQVEDGLPQNYVSFITQSREGYLIAGTAGGVVRFDGVRFTPVLLDQPTGITREWINVVQVAADGSLWIGTRDSGTYLNRAGHTVRMPEYQGSLTSLAVARDARLLSLSAAGLAEQASDKPRRILDPQLRAPDLSWNGITELPDHSILVAGTHGAVRFADGRSRILLPADSPLGHAYSFAAARSGGAWIGTSHGLLRMSQALMTPVAGVPGPVVAVVEDRDGVVWAATWGHGLYRVNGREVVSLSYRDGLPDDFVHALFEDSEGNLWIGSRAGLSRWKSGPVVTYGPAEGLNAQFISAVTGDNAGRIWVGSWRSGLFAIDETTPRKMPFPEPDDKLLVRALAAGPHNEIWMAGWHGGVFVRRGADWRRVPDEAFGFLPMADGLSFDAAGTLWIATTAGLYAYPNGAITPAKPRIAGHAFHALLSSRDGSVWAGAVDGLFHVQSGTISPIAGLPHAAVKSITEDSRGRIWVTTAANGITRIVGGVLRTYDQRHGLPPLPFYATLDDGGGSLWLASPAGIFQAPLAQFDELDAGSRSHLEPIPFGQEDGMRTIECQGAGYTTAWKAANGALWFATVKGVVRVDPHRERALPPPRALIESVESTASGHVVRFTAARLGSPARVEFRYRIDQLNPDWINAGTDRDIRYAGLPPGRHRVLISAREAGGAWSEPAVVMLFQPPRIYQTWWFRLLAVALIIGIAAAAYRWRVLILKGRYRAVLAERNRIAREWHDTMLAGYSAISWQLDTTLKRLKGNPDAAAQTVEVARNMVQHYRAEARRVIWDLRNEEPEPESLAASVGRAMTEILRDRAVEHSIQVEGTLYPLPGDLSQNLLRICQEASANAVSHASPSRIDVHLKFDPKLVSVSICDDGVGFEPAAVSPSHFGLAIMRERARRFGGDLKIDSGAGRGCVVTAEIPMPVV